MAEIASRERLQPSLLDRLTDTAPDVAREPLEQQSLSFAQLRQAVLRDLTWLLNTTNLATSGELSATPLAARSTLNFGVPGFSGLVATANRAADLERALTEAIRAFEPRIRADSLRVTTRERDPDEPVPTLVFEIHGELWAKPVPQQLFLETSIELETQLTTVVEARARG